MIAEVYPLKKGSSQFRVLDYEIPETLLLVRGDLVEIPLRGSKIFGIVNRVKDVPPRGIVLKQILKKILPVALKDEELSFFESIAQQIFQPVSTLLLATLPIEREWKKKKLEVDWRKIPLTIPTIESAVISRLSKQMTGRRSAFVQSPDLRRTAAIILHYLSARQPQKSLILCPLVHDARLLSRVLGDLPVLTVTGEETQAERFAIWQAYRQQSSGILVTTRTGMMFMDAQTSAVFVVRSGHSDHIQHKRHPRLDAREVARQFGDQFTTNVFFFDVCPAVEDFVRFGTQHVLPYPSTTPTQFIDASKERPVSPHVALTATCTQAIADALEEKKRVLIVYNKKGFGLRLRCGACDYRFVCDRCGFLLGASEHTTRCLRCESIAPIPLKCPACRASSLMTSGFGNERLAQTLQTWFPRATVSVVDSQHPQKTSSDICLVTKYFLENCFDPFLPDPISLVIHLDPDTPLFSPSFHATQNAIWSFYEWLGVAHASQAQYLIQTEEPELFSSYLMDGERRWCDDLNARKQFEQPPFSNWIQVTLKESERKKRELELHLLTESLQRLTNVRVLQEKTSLPDCLTVQIRFSDSEQNEVAQILSTLDHRYLIDTHAFF